MGTRTRRTDSIRTPALTLRTLATRVRAHRPLPATELRALTLPARRQARRRPPPTSTAISIRSSRRPSKQQPALRAPTTRLASRRYRRQRRNRITSDVNDPSPLAPDDGTRSAAAGPVLSSSTSSDTSNQTLPCRFECSITVSRCPCPYGRLIGQMLRWTYQLGTGGSSEFFLGRRLRAARLQCCAPPLHSSAPMATTIRSIRPHPHAAPTDGSRLLLLLVVRIDLRFDRPAATRTSRTNWQDALLSAILVRFPSDLPLIPRFPLRHRLPYRFFRSPPPRPSSGALSPLGPRWNAPMVATRLRQY